MATAPEVAPPPYAMRRIVRDLVQHRELLWNLISKDFRVRYRYAVMGFLWAIIEPLLMCLVLTFVFSVVFDLRQVDDTITSRWDFAMILLCALIPWQFFSHAIATATNSLLEHRDLVGKVYFPREIVPLSSIGIAFVNFLFAFAILLAVLTVVGRPPGVTILWVPVILAVQGAFIVGLALLLACANVYFRDVRYMVEVGLIFAFYATPIFYTVNMVEARVAEQAPVLFQVYMLNPMIGIVESYRAALFYYEAPTLRDLAWPAIAAVVLVVVGAAVFRRRAGRMADYL